MRQLVIECASEACSAALFEDGKLLAGMQEILGRGHAERLIPMIASLPDNGKAGQIFVSRGPGSFTGVRIGLAAARALGLVWQAECFTYPTLAIVAAGAQAEAQNSAVTVSMNGGHGEWFVQNFAANGLAEDAPRSLAPEEAAKARLHPIVAGNRAREMAALCESESLTALELLPDARFFIAMHQSHISTNLSAEYGRAADATPAK